MSTVSLQSLHSEDGKSSTGLDENIAVLLSYLFWWLGGLIFFIVEKKSKYVKFHALQSLVFGGVLFVVWLIFNIISGAVATAAIMTGGLGAIGAISAFGIIATILIIATWAVIIIAIVFALMKKDLVMPVIGPFAYKTVTK
jgi:uncharacterized membrane protein